MNDRPLTAVVTTALALAVAACATTGASGAGSTAPSPASRQRSRAGLLYATASNFVVQPQPASGSCHAIGSGLYARPDPACTPGALNPAVSQATIHTTICARGWTDSVRPPEAITEQEKAASMAAYGDKGPMDAYEYDHFVPLELGGATNDPRNLWPEPGASPNPKDAVEDKLRHDVCDGQLSLALARREIVKNWTSLVAPPNSPRRQTGAGVLTQAPNRSQNREPSKYDACMPGRLENKVALITGGGSGLGREMALLFASEGATVVVNDIDPGAGGRTSTEIGGAATFVQGDVSSEAEVQALFRAVRDRHGRLDVSIHNAGIMDPQDEGVTDTPRDVWDRVLAVDMTGVFLCCRHAIPLMLESERASSLINIASFVALMGAAAPQIAYTASKGGVLAMTREIAVQYARRGIRANAICPGPIRTPLLEYLIADEGRRQNRLNHIPAGRFGEPRDIAYAALYLASDESAWVTGTQFVVDGGITAAYLTEP